jgi:hypothetical protein
MASTEDAMLLNQFQPTTNTGSKQSLDLSKGKYQGVGTFHSGEPIFTDRAGIEERQMITENLYESHDEEGDLYTFTIV